MTTKNTDTDAWDDWEDAYTDYGGASDEEGNMTQPFQPQAALTLGAAAGPYHGGEGHEMQDFDPEQSGMSDTDPLLPQKNQSWDLTKALWPSADPLKLETFMEQDPNPDDPNSGKRLRIMVKMQGQGKKAHPLYARDRLTGKEHLNPALPKEIIKALGPAAEKQIAKGIKK